ncbi:pentapeptide repeat-containing protein [Streptomyces olivaceiscleroticus]|uniref:pentapeptide repeat-containing protein n=1 Tax=Streptomyces olivaceiscleroticus TaxID=68245 RepID=UPI003D157952
MVRPPRRNACNYSQPGQPACPGRRLAPGRCLAHLSQQERLRYLDSLSYGQNVDFSSTIFTSELLSQVLDSVRDPGTGRSGFSLAKFSGAVFTGPANFDSVDFLRDATFLRAHFHDEALFIGVKFHAQVHFGDSKFERGYRFDRITFPEVSIFANASFKEAGSFVDCTFLKSADFRSGTFASVSFMRTKFHDRCSFAGSTFSGRAARFIATQFFRTADFTASSFRYGSQFRNATFASEAQFADSSHNGGGADFTEARFEREANFSNASFARGTFTRATFSADVNFDRATFDNRCFFTEATFSKATSFRETKFHRDVHFVRAKFERSKHIGPMTSDGAIVFNGTSFESPMTLEASAVDLAFRQTEWSSTGGLRMRRARVDLSGATFTSAMIIATALTPFPSIDGGIVDDSNIGEALPNKITSLQGTDVSKLLLVDVDLRECRFAGAMHLDQIRLEGECHFSTSPHGFHYSGWRVTRWSQRRVLAEEAEWRSNRPSPRGWNSPSTTTSVTPATLSATYRHLRKSFEDSKNEPDAADFYYGEMEMRRNDRNRPRSERYLLTLYCLVSGYGLRASRALIWLSITITATLTALILWGVPAQASEAVSNGVIRGHTFQEVTTTPKPINPTGSLHSRVTAQRFEKAFRVVVNSVAFRSSGQTLTTPGTYIEMSSRIVEPIFLGLALLAIRSRLKR